MKIDLEHQDIEPIAQRVIELLKPILKDNGKLEQENIIFDVKGLCSYLKVSDKWVYERTHLKEIPYLKVNGLLRFRKKDIDKWLSSFNMPLVSKSTRILRAVK
ncbi:MAG: helix-turn-helix domain-containing protein [Bacillota bacterium]